MAVTWTKDLTVGVDLIDDQHKTWFSKADQLFEAGNAGKGKEKIVELLGFLDSYTREHFRDEEKYMESIGYPALGAQKAAHANFIAELDKLRASFEQSGGSIVVIIKANKMIVDWLIGHISSMDKKIGEFAASRAK